MPAASRPRSSSRPAGPTNGSPARSSLSPGCSPTSMIRDRLSPSPKTVWLAPCQRWQPRQPSAASRSAFSVRRSGRKGVASLGSVMCFAIPAPDKETPLDYETLIYEQDEYVVTLTYNRPDQHNAINRRMNEELQHAWQRFRDDDSAFVLVITGAGETTFSAGWDLQDASELREPPGWESWRREGWNSPGGCGYPRRVEVFKPVIAAVNGYAFAAGLETALLADIRIAAENAEFGALERRWNIVGGDGLTVRLPLVVGYAKAMELLITGRRIDVREAERIGLVNEVVPRGRALGRALELAHEVAALPQGAIRADKESVMRHVGRTLDERLRLEAEMTMSMWMRRDSHTIGASAFKERRTPEWPNHGL